VRKQGEAVTRAKECSGSENSGEFMKLRRMSWAALIRKVYEVEPQRCPDCGGEMKIVSLNDKCQPAVVEKILRHCGLWKEVVSRPPPAVSRVADSEPSYDYGYFDLICI